MENPALKYIKLRQWPELLDIARDFVHGKIDYDWTENEILILERAFTNIDKRIFFFFNVLPANMITVLLAMYSRIKNPRGIRGIFVDSFIPQILTMFIEEFKEDTEKNRGAGDEFSGDPVKYLKKYEIENLQDFISHSNPRGVAEGEAVFNDFVRKWNIDVKFFARISGAERMRRFLSTWLDKYGHNSIARPSMFYLCCEQISILAAKSIEWTRPGSGYIELSTRYVDMSGKDSYPVENELNLFGIDPEAILENTSLSFESIQALQGDGKDGAFSNFLWHHYAGSVPEEKLKVGVTGETFDVVNNLLPCSTLTSVGMGLSGEALPQLIRHLWLDQTPENDAIAEMVMAEALKVGADQFLEFVDISEWYYQSWQYQNHLNSDDHFLPPVQYVEQNLYSLFLKKPDFAGCASWKSVIARLKSLERSKFDKIFNEFESVSALFGSVMSFRSWRDSHRMGFSTHQRSLVTPLLGFYAYDKPAPKELSQLFNKVHANNDELYRKMKKSNVPETMRQYPMAMGNLISYTMGANLLQWEFTNWQRTKPSVNHEVRQQFLKCEMALRQAYPWWADISRADVCPAYVFARGDSNVPLSEA